MASISSKAYVDEHSVLHLDVDIKCRECWAEILVKYSDGHVAVFPPRRRGAGYGCLRRAGDKYPVVGHGTISLSFLLLPGFPRPVEAVVRVYEGGRVYEEAVDLSRLRPRYSWAREVVVQTPRGTAVVHASSQEEAGEIIHEIIRRGASPQKPPSRSRFHIEPVVPHPSEEEGKEEKHTGKQPIGIVVPRPSRPVKPPAMPSPPQPPGKRFHIEPVPPYPRRPRILLPA